MGDDRMSLRTVDRVVALDGVRGIAILMVMAVHCFWITPLSPFSSFAREAMSGFLLGVDLFFVLSGYLITGILIRTRSEPGYFRRFYTSRALRILPAYYFVLALVWLVLPKLDSAVRDATLHDYTLYYVLHVQNWLMAFDRPDLGWAGTNHFWSLAVEEQFYLAWPLVVLLTPPQWLRRVCLAMIAACVALKLVLAGMQANWLVVYMSTATRVDGLAMGALIATLRTGVPAVSADNVGRVGLLAGIALIGTIVALPQHHDAMVVSLETTLAMIAFGAAVYRIHVGATPWTGTLLQSRALLWLGRYSYGIYLLHLPLTLVLRRWSSELALMPGLPTNLRSLVVGVGCVTVSLVLARLMHRVLEQPALNLRDRLLAGYGLRRTRMLSISTTTANPMAK